MSKQRNESLSQTEDAAYTTLRNEVSRLEQENRELKTLNGQVLDNIIRTLVDIQKYIMDQKFILNMTIEERAGLLAAKQQLAAKK